MSRLKRLIVEIHLHSLWRIIGIYLGGACLTYEISQGVTEGSGLLAGLAPHHTLLDQVEGCCP